LGKGQRNSWFIVALSSFDVWKHISHDLKPLHRKLDLLEKHAGDVAAICDDGQAGEEIAPSHVRTLRGIA
jgi:hypothetical protein